MNPEELIEEWPVLRVISEFENVYLKDDFSRDLVKFYKDEKHLFDISHDHLDDQIISELSLREKLRQATR